MTPQQRIIVLDFGSQYSELIARRIRECHVFSEVLPHDTTLQKLKDHHVQGIIFSGGPSSVFEDNAPVCDPDILTSGIPIFGICYGMHLITKQLGGMVQRGKKHEYGKANLLIDNNADLFEGLLLEMSIWMSHGDSITQLPDGFQKLAHTENCSTAAIGDKSSKIYGVQFHPEVAHTPKGMDILRNFVLSICGCEPSWTAASFIEEAIKKIQEEVQDKKVICALSGGVDSTTVSALLKKAIGDQLTCIFIDQGFMRKGESKRIRNLFTDKFKIDLLDINASERFYKKISGVVDPEKKRKLIGEEFIRTFEEKAVELKSDYPFLAQGTLYSDVIESATVGVSSTAVKIKTHHNVGGLPEKMAFTIIEPLKRLFKDEVRKVGLELGVPEEIVFRQPFPGPGLAIRILGEVTKDRVKILQEADVIVMDEIKAAGLYRKIWQAFAVLLPIKTVGVQGDKRTYLNTIAVRAVSSEDAMTATWVHLPYDLLERISSRIINEVQGVNRVVYDISSKPPATIEWE
ncbi:MAG: glutamine-hydrolyzing GMP synthase [Candidatus Margulisbacteria bacterium]|nr:glutamine-hydrolyzing GMP synthase [Candidatus Margulisiibacteriota bacterium]